MRIIIIFIIPGMKIKTKIITVALVFLTMFVCVFYIISLNKTSNLFTESVINFKVEKGASAKSIIKNLKDKHIIKSELYAYIYLRLKKLQLKAGVYEIKSSMTVNEILQNLTKGSPVLKKITIPEGLSLKKIASLFDESGFPFGKEMLLLASDKNFLHQNGINAETAEGFLYPDTYFFGEDDTPEEILKIIIKTFFEKIKTVANCPDEFDELYKILILASIIEREYRIEEEAVIISSVFTNRLKINMGLQSCATVGYIITEIKNKKHPKRLFYEDLEIQSPYNTYLYAGLPPGPICSPGLTALNAACNPAKTNYLYFRLADVKTGKHVFTRTIQEHNRAGNLLLLGK